MSYDTGWFKSSRSSGGSNACVEVRLTDQAVDVRDSKVPEAGHIQVSHAAWRAFLNLLR
ncbi:DUF397 domain-containing protein [Saccharopolyspora sp. ASAGF58]|uniref:DUF397 domain-containing protein n=1 Tax=Saccharopolyspora sp. ASAGF58 TaxID=2719023 RepID=UPI00143FDC77|nr:DUF397 domain-containing protein [Saccharopolyspora sp. ASAGF58]QIZ34047.1 DUF397 domain-containing protein [Saccharopolyspora sp. ASAGF58]